MPDAPYSRRRRILSPDATDRRTDGLLRGGSGFTLLLPLILIVGMIWFMSRTQRKQRQRQAETVASLAPGTKVVTTSGLVGIVEETDDEYVTLEISDGVLVQVVKAAIGRVIPDEVAHEETPDEPEVEEKDEADEPVAEEEPAKDPVDVPDAVATSPATRPMARCRTRRSCRRRTPRTDLPVLAACGAPPGVHQTMRRAQKHKG